MQSHRVQGAAEREQCLQAPGFMCREKSGHRPPVQVLLFRQVMLQVLSWVRIEPRKEFLSEARIYLVLG